MATRPDPKSVARRVRSALAKLYPNAHCALKHDGPIQLLVATILSAQCTDTRVNLVTPALFTRFKTAKDFAEADSKELERMIQSTGFFRAKAKSIKESSRAIVERFGGEVPGRLDDLVTLPGVGRKTANVVLGDCFDVPGITVDTHVGRLSRRLGLTVHEDAVKVEHDLMALIPKKEWTIFSHRMIFHGRQICFARKPACDRCLMNSFCPKIGVAAGTERNEPQRHRQHRARKPGGKGR
jgi:endonuclease-3